mmetsp:Transcript_116144/g.202003  ORF Transcript_116144/g.202003 Transcript_116144/m.202003 type:complete len:142 (-) Transcript_116144:151-576(-)
MHDPIEGEAGIASRDNLWSALAPGPQKAKKKGAYKHRKRQRLLEQVGKEFASKLQEPFDSMEEPRKPISIFKEELEMFPPTQFVETPHSPSSTSPATASEITLALSPDSTAEGFLAFPEASVSVSPNGHVNDDAVLFRKSH